MPSMHQFVLEQLTSRKRGIAKIAREAGVPLGTLRKIRSGKTENPGVRNLQLLADYFRETTSNRVE